MVVLRSSFFELILTLLPWELEKSACFLNAFEDILHQGTPCVQQVLHTTQTRVHNCLQRLPRVSCDNIAVVTFNDDINHREKHDDEEMGRKAT